MAVSELEVKFKWENGASFEMTAKKDAEDAFIVVKADENTYFNALWEHFKAICIDYIDRRLDVIGNEMKAG